MPATRTRIRITSRGILIASTVAAVILGTIVLTWKMVETSQSYQKKADEHAQEAAIHEANRANTIPPWSDDEARKAEYHSRMNRKWEYASTHPWMRVEPDPPPPR